MLDALLYFILGIPIGYFIYYLKQHKADLAYDIEVVKSEIVSFHVKLDKILLLLNP